MPLSRAKQAAWMKAYRAKKKAGGAALLPKALARKLHRLGISPAHYLTTAPVSLDDYRALERRLEAKVQRVEWQSSGIAKLQEQNTIQDQRITQLEADQARLELMMDSMLREGDLS